MKCNVKYKNDGVSREVILKCDYFDTVGSVKEKISGSVSIKPEYIAFDLQNDIILKDDQILRNYSITNECIIYMKLKVVVNNMYVTLEDDNSTFVMDYDASVNDLILKYCSTMKVSDILLSCEGTCLGDEYLRSYLQKKNCVFTAFSKITVQVIFPDNSHRDIECYQNDTVKFIRNELVQKGFLKKKNAVFMIENTTVYDGCELYKFGILNPLIIFVAFPIFVEKGNELLCDIIVNVHTKISYVRSMISKISAEPTSFSIMFREEYLNDENTVGFYHLSEGDRLKIIGKFIAKVAHSDISDIEEFMVNEIKTVGDIKNEISEQYKIDVNRIKLSLNNKDLSNDISFACLEFIGNQDLNLNILKTAETMNEEKSAEQFADKTICVSNEQASINVHNDNVLMNCNNSISSNPIGRCKQPIRTENSISLMIYHLGDLSHNNHNNRIVIDKTASIQYLHNQIYEQLHIAMCGLDIFFVGDVFVGGTLVQKNITDNCVLVLKPRQNRKNVNEQFVLEVKNQTKNSTNEDCRKFLIDNFMTVGGLKHVLRKEYDVNVNRIELTIEGELLDDDVVIREMDIENGSTAFLMIRDVEGHKESETVIRVRNSLNSSERNVIKNICVNGADTVATLRKQLETLYGLSEQHFNISFNGEILKENNLLTTYNICEGSEIVISQSLIVRFFIGDNGNGSRNNRYAFVPWDTVLDLKLNIQRNLRIEPRFINLSYNGVNMEDNDMLEYYEIENDSYIMMIATLAGGVQWR